jgi:proteasome lid subunit RPN8/RPN11
VGPCDETTRLLQSSAKSPGNTAKRSDDDMMDRDQSRATTSTPDRAHAPLHERESVAADVPRAVTCSQAAFASIVTAMRAALPCEGVVVLGGARTAALLHITHVVPVPNLSFDYDRFAVAPEAFAAAVASLGAATFQGFAHSHPGAQPEPSATDHRELWHNCLHAIASDAGGSWSVRWFWRTAGGFLPLAFVSAEP